MTILGFVLYGSTVLVPLLLQTLMGYSAMDAGVVMLPRGLGSFIMMPLVGYLMSKIEPRLLLGTGIFAAVMSFFRFSHLSLDFGYWNFFWPLLLQGSSLGLIFIPLTTLTNGEVPKEQMGNATSLFNLMRNIGASIGISMAQTWMARDQQKHLSDLARFASGLSDKFAGFIQQLTSYFVSLGHDPSTAKQMAMAAGAGRLQHQAAILSYNQVFFIFAAMFAGMFPLIFLMRRPRGKTAEVMVH
jgi:DHA2 family multidrug resistance protein